MWFLGLGFIHRKPTSF